MNHFLILLQQQQGGGLIQMLMFAAIFVIFYFFMIRPQVKRQKAEKLFRESLTKGMKVVTIGGIHGRIVEVADTTFLIEIDTNVKVRCEKSSISAEATKALDAPVKKA